MSVQHIAAVLLNLTCVGVELLAVFVIKKAQHDHIPLQRKQRHQSFAPRRKDLQGCKACTALAASVMAQLPLLYACLRQVHLQD